MRPQSHPKAGGWRNQCGCAAWPASFQDTSGQGDIHLVVSVSAGLVSSSILILVGLLAGMIPAARDARLDPVLAIRCN